MAENTQLAEKPHSFSEILTTSLTEVRDGLPNEFNMTRFVQNAVALLNGNEVLSKFAKQYGTAQIKAGLMRGAFLGLDALNQECHLVPYGNTLNFSVDYRGDMKLIKKYSTRPVIDVYAKLVRQGDEFQLYIKEGRQTFDFKPLPFNDGAIIGAFAVILYKDGGLDIEEMSLKELEKVRSKSKMSNGMAWKDFTGEMYKKTVIHRIKKKATLEFENPVQKEYWEEEMKIKTEKEEIDLPDISEDFVDVEVVESEVVE